MEKINSEEVRSKLPLVLDLCGDYLPINIPLEAGETRGDYTMIGIGPYDYWAIEYGYTPDESKLDAILQRCSEPELRYATDEDTNGPDPLARRYDYAADPLDYANNQMKKIKRVPRATARSLRRRERSIVGQRHAKDMNLRSRCRCNRCP